MTDDLSQLGQNLRPELSTTDAEEFIDVAYSITNFAPATRRRRDK